MNSERYPIYNYVPINPMKRMNSNNFGNDLDDTLQKMKQKKIMDDPEYHFKNCYIINFDLIHNECRGDELSNTRKDYETIFMKKINEEIETDDLRYRFISNAIKSERKDVFLQQDFLMNILTEINQKQNQKRKVYFYLQ